MNLPTPHTLWSAAGCKQCQGLGYHGRTGVFELWRLDETDYELLLSHASEHALRERFNAKSDHTLLQDAFAKVADGTTSLAEVRKLGGLSPLHSAFHRPNGASSRPSRTRFLRPR